MSIKYNEADFWNHTHTGGISLERSNLVISDEHIHPRDKGSINADRWQMTPGYTQPSAMTHEANLDFLCRVWVADPSGARLLKEIKDSHYKAYSERLTYHEAYAKLEKMRVDAERQMTMRKSNDLFNCV